MKNCNRCGKKTTELYKSNEFDFILNERLELPPICLKCWNEVHTNNQINALNTIANWFWEYDDRFNEVIKMKDETPMKEIRISYEESRDAYYQSKAEQSNLKNFKAKELIEDLITWEFENQCRCCKKMTNEFIKVENCVGVSFNICLDCLQYEGEE